MTTATSTEPARPAEPQPADLAPKCAANAARVAEYAAAYGITAVPGPVPSIVAYRLAWDAPAAGEFIRPMLADGADAAVLWPPLAETIWHHIAGATILHGGCHCLTPAGHRDALIALARILPNAH